jgi:type IV secretory pathway VirB4 component
MQPDILNEIQAQGPALWPTVLGGLASLGAIGTALVGGPLLGSKLLPSVQETRLAEFIPFRRLAADGQTIHCHNGTLVRCIEVQGYDLSAATAAQREGKQIARKLWLDAMIDAECEVHTFLVRDRIDPTPAELPENDILARLVTSHASGLGDLYRNRHYIMLSTPGGGGAEARLDKACDHIAANLAD